MKTDAPTSEAESPSFVEGQILTGPARLEQELALISCIFQKFCLPSKTQTHILKRRKLSELVLVLAD